MHTTALIFGVTGAAFAQVDGTITNPNKPVEEYRRGNEKIELNKSGDKIYFLIPAGETFRPYDNLSMKAPRRARFTGRTWHKLPQKKSTGAGKGIISLKGKNEKLKSKIKVLQDQIGAREIQLATARDALDVSLRKNADLSKSAAKGEGRIQENIGYGLLGGLLGAAAGAGGSAYARRRRRLI